MVKARIDPRQKAKDKLERRFLYNTLLTERGCRRLAEAIVDGVVDATMQELCDKWQRKGARALEEEQGDE